MAPFPEIGRDKTRGHVCAGSHLWTTGDAQRRHGLDVFRPLNGWTGENNNEEDAVTDEATRGDDDDDDDDDGVIRDDGPHL